MSYKIPVISGDTIHISGPYRSIFTAETNALDIGNREGVIDLKIYKENITQLLEAKLLADY